MKSLKFQWPIPDTIAGTCALDPAIGAYDAGLCGVSLPPDVINSGGLDDCRLAPHLTIRSMWQVPGSQLTSARSVQQKPQLMKAVHFLPWLMK